MILILEGPDGGGKTVLATHLRARYNWEYVHTGPPKPGENLLLSYATTLYDAHQSRKDVVIDRLHVGERIYGSFCRGVDLLGDEGLTILERIISAYRARVIFCLPPFKNIESVWQQRYKNEFIQELGKLEAIYLKYSQIAALSNSPTWDYGMMSYVKLAEMIINQPRKANPLMDHVVGSPLPKFLFIGEKANQEYLDLPWISLSGSSHYLYEALRDAGFKEPDIAFVNALKLDGSPNNLKEIYDVLNKPTLIALGQVASDHIAKTEIGPYYALPHPAYWKRFHSDKRDTFITLLGSVLHDHLGLDRVP